MMLSRKESPAMKIVVALFITQQQRHQPMTRNGTEMTKTVIPNPRANLCGKSKANKESAPLGDKRLSAFHKVHLSRSKPGISSTVF